MPGRIRRYGRPPGPPRRCCRKVPAKQRDGLKSESAYDDIIGCIARHAAGVVVDTDALVADVVRVITAAQADGSFAALDADGKAAAVVKALKGANPKLGKPALWKFANVKVPAKQRAELQSESAYDKLIGCIARHAAGVVDTAGVVVDTDALVADGRRSPSATRPPRG